MSRFFTEAHSAEAVNARIDENTGSRLKEIVASLVAHLHAFARICTHSSGTFI